VAGPTEALEVDGSIVVSGTIDNGLDAGLEIHANNEVALQLLPDATSPIILGGHSSNSVHADASGSVIAGGGQSGQSNAIYDAFSVIAGGAGNFAGLNDSDPTLHGYASVGGGLNNDAAGLYGTIGGGWGNTIDSASTGGIIPGGRDNYVSGNYSMAAGYRAVAAYDGSFVWGDSQNSDISCIGADQFIIRARGGIWLGDNSLVSFPLSAHIATSTGAFLSLGGIWISISDRDAKEDAREIDGDDLLARVSDLPIYNWTYKVEGDDGRHIGPYAQDFYAQFGLGSDDRHIAATDMAGVSLRAIQVLTDRIEDLESRLTELDSSRRDCCSCTHP
tara:strand:+ start:108 stop:1106 length:999 start_codon:yes stop_codon:yes gene_type:complete